MKQRKVRTKDMNKRMKTVGKRVLAGTFATLYGLTILGNTECKASSNIEKGNKETYLVYGAASDSVIDSASELNGITSDILEENNVSIVKLSESDKKKMKQKGYHVEKDIQLDASSEEQVEAGEDYEQWNLDAIHVPE